MIVGLGLDVVELARIERAHERFGEAFSRRILTASELASRAGRDPIPTLAGCFAAKEAAVKALGTGFSTGITFQCVEILPDPLGRPVLRLSGPARDRAREIGADAFHVSISHGRDTAAAVVVAERLPAAPLAATPCSGCPSALPATPRTFQTPPDEPDPGLWRGPDERVFPDPARKRRHPARRPRGESS